MVWAVLALLALAIVVTALAGVRLQEMGRRLAACRNWTPVTGRVLDRSIREVFVDDVGSQYIPVVRYRYVVAGVHYESQNLTIGYPVQYSLRRSAERRIARYTADRAVQVHVDPADPSSAVLECRAPFVTILWTMIAILWIVVIGIIATLLFAPGVVGPGPFLP